MSADNEQGERGSAVVEAALLGTLVFGLLVQLIVTFGFVQQATLAATAAARDAGRAVSLADDDADAEARVGTVVREAARNHGLAPDALHVQLAGAVVRDGIIEVTVRTDVAMLHLPGLGAVWKGLALPVSAHYRVRVDRFRGFGA